LRGKADISSKSAIGQKRTLEKWLKTPKEGRSQFKLWGLAADVRHSEHSIIDCK